MRCSFLVMSECLCQEPCASCLQASPFLLQRIENPARCCLCHIDFTVHKICSVASVDCSCVGHLLTTHCCSCSPYMFISLIYTSHGISPPCRSFGQCTAVPVTCEPLSGNTIDWECIFGDGSLVEVESRGGKMVSCPTGTKVEPCSRYEKPEVGGGRRNQSVQAFFVLLDLDGVGQVDRPTSSIKAKICPSKQYKGSTGRGTICFCNQFIVEPVVDGFPSFGCGHTCCVPVGPGVTVVSEKECIGWSL